MLLPIIRMKKIFLFFIFFLILFVYGCQQQIDTSLNKGDKQQITEEGVVPTQIEKVECRIDSDCDNNKYCSNNKCFQINCPNGYIVNHICKEYECTSNSQCRNDEVCQSNECIKLDCSIGLLPQNHKCTYTILEDKKGYITPFDQRVKEKVDRLTNTDYSESNFGGNLKDIYYYSTSISYRYDDN